VKEVLKKNLLMLVGMAVLLFLGLGTTLDEPHSFMSAVYVGDSEIEPGLEQHDFSIPGLAITMKWLQQADWTMGSPEDEAGRSKDERLHRVKLTQGFWLSKHEVCTADFAEFVTATGHRTHSEMANALYNSVTKERVAGKTWRSAFADNANTPVVGVSLWDAYAFCRWLTERERKAGRLSDAYLYTVPTEAQWEYACRAGQVTRFSFGDDTGALHHYANFADRSSELKERDFEQDDGFAQAAPVGSYRPNAWGLHDMHGNVSEFCADTYWKDYQEDQSIDPLGPAGLRRDQYLIRGGGWASPAEDLRSASRRVVPAMDAYWDVGFRIAMRRRAIATVYTLTAPNRAWHLIRSGAGSAIKHDQLPAAKAGRVIQFPQKQSLGFPKARIRGAGTSWVTLPMRASGPLEVPSGIEIKLLVNKVSIRSDRDLTPLDDLKPYDLTGIEITEEKLGGAALRHISHLTGLRSVEVHSRRLRDSGLVHLAELAALTGLNLAETKVRGPGLGFLKHPDRVRHLDLSGTKITDETLAHLEPFTQLELLRLGRTAVSRLGICSKQGGLKELDLSGTSVTDAGLVGLSQLANLERLGLEDTFVTSKGLFHLSKLTNLKGLDLRRTAVDDEGLAHLAGLVYLEELSLGEGLLAGHAAPNLKSNLITDKGLRYLTAMGHLQTLHVNQSGINGRGFSELKDLVNLRELSLKECQIDDAGLKALAELKGLEVLDISANEVRDAGLKTLAALPNLRRVIAIGTGVTPAGAEAFGREKQGTEVLLEESIDSLMQR
jgi:formylglycine-generating enzyme required for sulfatase activity/Leucine-rich repeat (LRR) protein